MEEKQGIPVNMNPVLAYVNAANIGFGDEEFVLRFFSGNQGFQFAFSPKHLKRLSLLLEKHIEEYEKKFGELKTELPRMEKASAEKDNIGF